MKRLVYIAIVLILSVVSCNRTDKILEFSTDTAMFKEEIPYAEDKQGQIKIDWSFEYPSEGTPKEVLESLQKSLIKEILIDSSMFQLEADSVVPDDFQQAVEKRVGLLVNAYKSEVSEIYKDCEDQPSEYMINWDSSCQGKFGESHASVISYYIESSAYSGGAHGIYGTVGSLFSLKDGSHITQDQYFIRGYEEKLTSLLIKYLRNCLGESPISDNGDELGEDDDEIYPKPYPNDNIYFTQNGVVFTYQPYEIASYAEGQMTAEIPWAEIEPLIRSEYK